MAIAAETIYLNADKSKTVAEGSTDAAYLLVREGGQISDGDVEKYGVKTKEAETPIEEPNIVVSGGVNSGPALVKGEPLHQENEAESAEGGSSQKTSSKTSSKKAK